ncbi:MULTISPECIES: hypothetical protein [Paraburkholderia]|nr:hypothetical protein [Paraburkholderia aromaticivorans]
MIDPTVFALFVTLDFWSVVASLLVPTAIVSPLVPRPVRFS